MNHTGRVSIREVSAVPLLSAKNWNAQPREAMISITGTGEARVRFRRGWARVLRVCFDDIEVPMPGGTLFTEDHADKIIEFLDRIEGDVDHIVVHCTHGLSRSPAVARYISQRYDLANSFWGHMTFNRHVYATLFWRWRHRVAPGEGGCCDMGYARAGDPIYSTSRILFAGKKYPRIAGKDE